ncbi:MAG: hypothetical protein KAU48_10670 [Candidatus Thorarchaeota archaeon]|nr:hypothetical protein [Candidatus Thorarchaeota archaeon]
MKVPMERTKSFAFVAFLWIINALLRIVFGVMSSQGSLLDNPVPLIIDQILIIVFLILGILGLITTYGFLKLELWGIQGVVIVSLLTIIFDIWGITIQFTAALGFIVPAISLLYLAPRMFKEGILGEQNGSEEE